MAGRSEPSPLPDVFRELGEHSLRERGPDLGYCREVVLGARRLATAEFNLSLEPRLRTLARSELDIGRSSWP